MDRSCTPRVPRVTGRLAGATDQARRDTLRERLLPRLSDASPRLRPQQARAIEGELQPADPAPVAAGPQPLHLLHRPAESAARRSRAEARGHRFPRARLAASQGRQFLLADRLLPALPGRRHRYPERPRRRSLPHHKGQPRHRRARRRGSDRQRQALQDPLLQRVGDFPLERDRPASRRHLRPALRDHRHGAAQPQLAADQEGLLPIERRLFRPPAPAPGPPRLRPDPQPRLPPQAQ